MNSTIQVRTAQPEEAKEIAALVNFTFRGEDAKRGWTTEAHFLDGQRTDEARVCEMIQAPESQIEVAIEDAALIGCAHFKIENHETLYIGMLTVNPNAQARGVGHQLVTHAEVFARQKNLRQLRALVVHFRFELLAFFQRRGFRATGRMEPFPTDPAFGIPRVDNLYFVELTKPIVK